MWRLSDSQFNKLKSGTTKNNTEVTLNLSSNIIGKTNDETNFPSKLLLTDRQFFKLGKAFMNNQIIKISNYQKLSYLI